MKYFSIAILLISVSSSQAFAAPSICALALRVVSLITHPVNWVFNFSTEDSARFRDEALIRAEAFMKEAYEDHSAEEDARLLAAVEAEPRVHEPAQEVYLNAAKEAINRRMAKRETQKKTMQRINDLLAAVNVTPTEVLTEDSARFSTIYYLGSLPLHEVQLKWARFIQSTSNPKLILIFSEEGADHRSLLAKVPADALIIGGTREYPAGRSLSTWVSSYPETLEVEAKYFRFKKTN